VKIDVRSPFPFEALPRIWLWGATFRAKVADDFAPQTLEEFMFKAAEGWERLKTWAIYADEELGGWIAFEKITPWLGTAHLLLKPEHQARGIAVRACKIAIAEMFATGVGKLSFYPLAGNLAIGSLLINLGAKREGTLVGQTLVSGKPTDIWLYGLNREDFSAICNSSSDRGSVEHRRQPAIGQTKDHDVDVDPHLLARDAGVDVAVGKLQ